MRTRNFLCSSVFYEKPTPIAADEGLRGPSDSRDKDPRRDDRLWMSPVRQQKGKKKKDGKTTLTEKTTL